jgi:hypothetical protein
MAMRKMQGLWIGGVVAALAFAWFVWPTPWAYYGPVCVVYGGPTLIRRNRFTNDVEVRVRGRYVPTAPEAAWVGDGPRKPAEPPAPAPGSYEEFRRDFDAFLAHLWASRAHRSEMYGPYAGKSAGAATLSDSDPLDFEARCMVLRVLVHGTRTFAGTDLARAAGPEGFPAAYQRSIEREFARLAPGVQTIGDAKAMLDRLR